MPPYVFFARHGETKANHLKYLQSQTINEPLTKIGREQAKNLGVRIANESIKVILTSRAIRAIETSLIISKTIISHPSVIAESDFLEIDMGRLDGLSYHEIKQKYHKLFDAWWGNANPKNKQKLPFPDGESLAQIVARARRAIESIERKLKIYQGNILVVGHGSMNNIIISCLLNIKPEEFFNALFPNNCGLIKIDTDLDSMDYNGRKRIIIT